MTDFEKFLDLVAEYQSVKKSESVIRTKPLERTSAMVATEAELMLRDLLGVRDGV